MPFTGLRVTEQKWYIVDCAFQYTYPTYTAWQEKPKREAYGVRTVNTPSPIVLSILPSSQSTLAQTQPRACPLCKIAAATAKDGEVTPFLDVGRLFTGEDGFLVGVLLVGFQDFGGCNPTFANCCLAILNSSSSAWFCATTAALASACRCNSASDSSER